MHFSPNITEKISCLTGGITIQLPPVYTLQRARQISMTLFGSFSDTNASRTVIIFGPYMQKPGTRLSGRQDLIRVSLVSFPKSLPVGLNP